MGRQWRRLHTVLGAAGSTYMHCILEVAQVGLERRQGRRLLAAHQHHTLHDIAAAVLGFRSTSQPAIPACCSAAGWEMSGHSLP